jgi:hypothetical protein
VLAGAPRDRAPGKRPAPRAAGGRADVAFRSFRGRGAEAPRHGQGPPRRVCVLGSDGRSRGRPRVHQGRHCDSSLPSPACFFGERRSRVGERRSKKWARRERHVRSGDMVFITDGTAIGRASRASRQARTRWHVAMTPVGRGSQLMASVCVGPNSGAPRRAGGYAALAT